MTANAWCPSRQFEWLVPEEQAPCSWHHLSDEGLLVVWPQEYRQWAAGQGLLQASERSALRPERPNHAVPTQLTADVKTSRSLEIVNPPTGATYLIDPTLRRDFQTLPLRVTSARPGRIDWLVNGVALGSSQSDAAVMWPLAPGTHTITARDGAGNVAEARIFVR